MLISSTAGGYNSIVLFAFTLYFLFHSTFILKNCVYPQVVAVNDGIEYYDYAVLSNAPLVVRTNFAIISLGMRELVALLLSSNWCHVAFIVLCLFLMMP